jgi:EAL domain-containing protein (putative c-di-GMP-specific phosphodiesterase class I)
MFILKKTSSVPKNVTIILELSASEHEFSQTANLVNMLRENGVKIALDGFGVGYSTIETIKRFPVEIIKIGRNFVMSFIEDNLQYTIVKALIMIAHAANTVVCAEGVESAEHIKLLVDANCDCAQGIHYLKASPAEQFAIQLSKQAL